METHKTEWTSNHTSEKNIMTKRLITICTTATLVFSICGCGRTDGNTIAVEKEPVAENPSEDITVDADTTQHDSADMVYDKTLFTEENSDELYKLSGFEDLEYYIFCDTAMAYGPSDIIHTYGIYGKTADEWEDGEQLYQEFKTDFFNEPGIEADTETDEIVYISPDGRWVITQRYLGLDERGAQGLREQTLYHNGQFQDKLQDTYSYDPFVIVKDGDSYKELEEFNYEMRKERSSNLYDNGYRGGLATDESGQYIAAIRYEGYPDQNPQLDMWEIAGEETVYSFSLQNVGENYFDIIQFYGNGREGTIILQSHRDFYELSYPSGEIRLLGKDIYAVSYSPDGKYLVYSSPDLEVKRSFDESDWEITDGHKEGIFVREIATRRTAYVECDVDNYDSWGVERREFYWLVKSVIDG